VKTFLLQNRFNILEMRVLLTVCRLDRHLLCSGDRYHFANSLLHSLPET